MRIGIDLGGTKIACGLVNNEGEIILRRKVPTNARSGYPGIVASITRLIDDIIAEAGITGAEIERIGIASAGQIDKHSHRIVVSPNLGLRDAPLKDDVEREAGVPVSIENDVNAAVYGEWKFGLGGAPSDVLGVFAGTGIGGGLVLGGRIYRGFSNVGGEIGHMTLNPYGYRCRCGNSGCFEAYCGGYYIAERVKKRVREGYRGRIWRIIEGNIEALNAGHIEKAYFEGDEFCVGVWEEVIEYLGAGLAGLANILNPEVIVLGGGVVYGTERLLSQAEEVMKKRAMAGSLAGLRLNKAGLGEDAAILGAAFIEE